MTPHEAISVIATHMAAELCESVWDSRELCPDIGERDWDAVCRQVDLAGYPDKATYDAAYQILTGRAEHDS